MVWLVDAKPSAAGEGYLGQPAGGSLNMSQPSPTSICIKMKNIPEECPVGRGICTVKNGMRSDDHSGPLMISWFSACGGTGCAYFQIFHIYDIVAYHCWTLYR